MGSGRPHFITFNGAGVGQTLNGKTPADVIADWDSDPGKNGIQPQYDDFGNTIRADGKDGRPLIPQPDRNDVFRGSGGNDVFQTGGGDDTVYGNGGQDRMDMGAGRDRAYGGTGEDWIEGGADGDILFGSMGGRPEWNEVESRFRAADAGIPLCFIQAYRAARYSASASRTNSAADISKAMPNPMSVVIVGCRMPRSIRDTNVRSTPARNASSSCDTCNLVRWRRRTSPKIRPTVGSCESAIQRMSRWCSLWAMAYRHVYNADRIATEKQKARRFLLSMTAR